MLYNKRIAISRARTGDNNTSRPKLFDSCFNAYVNHRDPFWCYCDLVVFTKCAENYDSSNRTGRRCTMCVGRRRLTLPVVYGQVPYTLLPVLMSRSTTTAFWATTLPRSMEVRRVSVLEEAFLLPVAWPPNINLDTQLRKFNTMALLPPLVPHKARPCSKLGSVCRWKLSQPHSVHTCYRCAKAHLDPVNSVCTCCTNCNNNFTLPQTRNSLF